MKDLPRDAQRLLDAARSAAGPTAAQRARADAQLRARLAQHGVDDLPPLDPTAGATAAQPGLSVGFGLKLGAAAAAAATIGLFVALGIRSQQQPRPAPAPAPAPPAATQPAPQAVAVTPAPPILEAAKAPEAGRAEGRAQVRSAAALGDEALRAELRLIAEANRLLQDERFDDALRVLAKHAQRFAHGVLRPERDGLRVLSLCGLGPNERARRERERYLRAAPRSPLAERVRAACDPSASAP